MQPALSGRQAGIAFMTITTVMCCPVACADDSEDLPPSAVVAQLPDVQPGEEWGVDASSSAGSDLSDDHDDDDDDDDSQTSSQADDELQWLRDLDAACQDL